MTMHVTVWSDYICPWCYLALDRVDLLGELGVEVTIRPFELHPEIGPEGRRHRPEGRTAAVFAQVGAECESLGLRFRSPVRTPNSHQVLQVAEFVRSEYPASFPALHRLLFEAHFAEGLDIGDLDVVMGLVERSGADSRAAIEAIDSNEAALRLRAARELATEAGVTGTPTMVFDSGLVVPGTPPRDTLRRWVTRMLDQSRN